MPRRPTHWWPVPGQLRSDGQRPQISVWTENRPTVGEHREAVVPFPGLWALPGRRVAGGKIQLGSKPGRSEHGWHESILGTYEQLHAGLVQSGQVKVEESVNCCTYFGLTRVQVRLR